MAITVEAKIDALAQKLLQITVKDEIKWDLTQPPPSLINGTNDLIPLFFVTTYKEKKIAIFIKKTQEYNGEFDNFYWNEQTGIAILGSERRVMLESSKPTRALNDLISIVREKSAGLDDLVSDLLTI